MKATLPTTVAHNGGQYDKLCTRTIHAIANRNGTPTELVTVRFYGTGSTVWCSVWVAQYRNGTSTSCNDMYSGRGNAKGYGYHKDSAALSAALDSAGITLSEDIDGRGDGTMRDALTAIVRATGCRGKVLIV